MIRMTLCPNCRTIQKAGTVCTICKCPVRPDPPPRRKEHHPAPRLPPLPEAA